jgi:hypothetical protein
MNNEIYILLVYNINLQIPTFFTVHPQNPSIQQVLFSYSRDQMHFCHKFIMKNHEIYKHIQDPHRINGNIYFSASPISNNTERQSN